MENGNGGKTLEDRVVDLESHSGELDYNLALNNKNMKALLEALLNFLKNQDPEANILKGEIEAYLQDVCRRPPGC